MNTIRNPLGMLATFAVATSLAFGQALAAPVIQPSVPEGFVRASGDCYAIGQSLAAQNGGTLARADSVNEGGQEVCKIVVLVPARDGKHPRRAEFTVPRG